MMITLEDSRAIDDFNETTIISSSLYSVSVNFKKACIEDIKVESVLQKISDLFNLSKISIIFNRSSLLLFRDTSLDRLVNLTKVSLTL